MPKRRAVINVEFCCESAIFEKVVDDPQAAAAPRAKSAAIAVALPVEKLIMPFGNVTKNAATRARAAHTIYFFEIFSLRKITAVVIANKGCNF